MLIFKENWLGDLCFFQPLPVSKKVEISLYVVFFLLNGCFIAKHVPEANQTLGSYVPIKDS